MKPRLSQSMHECVGARELGAMGFRSDVDVAASWDVSQVAPMLVDGAFRRHGDQAVSEG